MTDEYYMRQALKLARRAAELGEVPVGAVVVRDDKIIAFGYNRRETDKNALRHAEHIAMDNACKALGGWRLPGCTLYVTLEPCVMCAGAVINSRIERVVFGAYDEKGGAMGSKVDVNQLGLNFTCEVCGGVLQDECRAVLQDFFKNLRKRKE